jgi:AmmeMemoRadiSam system protein B
LPHAGWRYCGDVAAQTLRWLADGTPDATCVVLFGSHRGPHGPNTVFRGDAWETPLGPIPCARAHADVSAARLGLEDEPIRPRHPDNGVEVLLPLVRYFFPRASLLMLGVAAAEVALDIGRAVGAVLGAAGEPAVYLASTDLTHYGPRYDFTPRGEGAAAVHWVRDVNDEGFIAACARGAADEALQHGVERHSACCPGAAAAALCALESTGASPRGTVVRHTLSYDVSPDDNYVGYAGLVFA